MSKETMQRAEVVSPEGISKAEMEIEAVEAMQKSVEMPQVQFKDRVGDVPVQKHMQVPAVLTVEKVVEIPQEVQKMVNGAIVESLETVETLPTSQEAAHVALLETGGMIDVVTEATLEEHPGRDAAAVARYTWIAGGGGKKVKVRSCCTATRG